MLQTDICIMSTGQRRALLEILQKHQFAGYRKDDTPKQSLAIRTVQCLSASVLELFEGPFVRMKLGALAGNMMAEGLQ